MLGAGEAVADELTTTVDVKYGWTILALRGLGPGHCECDLIVVQTFDVWDLYVGVYKIWE